VAIVVQLAGERPGLDCSVTKKYGVVLIATVTELAVVLEILGLACVAEEFNVGAARE
jgi:hypothetical protein